MRAEKVRREKTKKNLEMEILTVIAKKGESWRYDLWNKENLASRKGVDEALKRLENKKLITVTRIEKRGATKTVYELTMSGLFAALCSEKTWEQINKVAQKHSDKLILFKAWNHFIDRKAKEKVVDAMKNFFKVTLGIKLDLSKEDEKMIEIYESQTCKYLNDHVLFFHLDLVRLPLFYEVSNEIRASAIKRSIRRTLEWAKVWADHPDLKRYMIRKLDFGKKEGMLRPMIIEGLKKYIESSEKSESGLDV